MQDGCSSQFFYIKYIHESKWKDYFFFFLNRKLDKTTIPTLLVMSVIHRGIVDFRVWMLMLNLHLWFPCCSMFSESFKDYKLSTQTLDKNIVKFKMKYTKYLIEILEAVPIETFIRYKCTYNIYYYNQSSIKENKIYVRSYLELVFLLFNVDYFFSNFCWNYLNELIHYFILFLLFFPLSKYLDIRNLVGICNVVYKP